MLSPTLIPNRVNHKGSSPHSLSAGRRIACKNCCLQRAAARQTKSSRLYSAALGSKRSKAGAHNDMNDSTDNIIVDTATRIFQDLCDPATVNEAEKGEWPKALWDALEESGLPLAWVPDDLGGAGATMADGFAVLRVAGRFAAPVPLAETLMAGWLLAQAGIAVPSGPLTVAPVHADGRIALSVDGTLSGRARRGPFARNAGHIAVLVRRGGDPAVALVAAAGLPISQSTRLAGEPRDDVSF